MGCFEFSPPPSPCLPAQAGGSDRDKASAGAFLSLVPAVLRGDSPAGLIKFLRAEEGGRGRWREGRKEDMRER